MEICDIEVTSGPSFKAANWSFGSLSHKKVEVFDNDVSTGLLKAKLQEFVAIALCQAPEEVEERGEVSGEIKEAYDELSERSTQQRIQTPYLFQLCIFDSRSFYCGNVLRSHLSSQIHWNTATRERLRKAIVSDSRDRMELTYLKEPSNALAVSVVFVINNEGAECVVIHQVKLQLIDALIALSFMMSASMFMQQHTREMIQKLEKECIHLQESLKDSNDALRAMVERKEETENEYLQKFAVLLSTKKQKYRDLKDQMAAQCGDVPESFVSSKENQRRITVTPLKSSKSTIKQPQQLPHGATPIPSSTLSIEQFEDMPCTRSTAVPPLTNTISVGVSNVHESHPYSGECDLDTSKGLSKALAASNSNKTPIITDPNKIDKALKLICVKQENASDSDTEMCKLGEALSVSKHAKQSATPRSDLLSTRENLKTPMSYKRRTKDFIKELFTPPTDDSEAERDTSKIDHLAVASSDTTLSQSLHDAQSPIANNSIENIPSISKSPKSVSLKDKLAQLAASLRYCSLIFFCF